MPIDHREVSEIVTGRAIKKKEDPNAINPQKLVHPFGQIVSSLQDGMDESDLFVRHGWASVDAALRAHEATKDREDVDWLKVLDEVAASAQAGARLERIAKKLQRGEEFDAAQLLSLVQNFEDGRLDFVPLGQVEPEEDVWIPTGYGPWDRHIGGMVKAGLTVVGGPPGTGKTTLLIRLMTLAARQGKRVGFFSLEMTLSQIVKRILEADSDLTREQRNRILATEEVSGVGEVYAKASRLIANEPDIAFIGIDFADLMVQHEQSEQVMGEIYRTLAVLAKRTGVPVILLSQLSRRYEGGLPRVTHLRYSGMAEAMASLIVLLYNPDSIYANMGGDRSALPYVPETAYIIVGKARYGFKEGGVGAFRVDWDGGLGWGNDSHGWWMLGGS